MRSPLLSIVLLALPAAAQTPGTYVFGPTGSLNAASLAAPGQIATFLVSGLSVQPNQPLEAAGVPLPAKLAGISAQISGFFDFPTPVPLLKIAPVSNCPSNPPDAACLRNLALTVEIPTEINDSDPDGNAFTAPDLLTISDASGNHAVLSVQVVRNAIHVLSSCPITGLGCGPIVTHADGSPLDVAHAGDVLVVYLYGLGKTLPQILSGDAAPLTGVAYAKSPVLLNFAFQPNAGPIRPPFTPYGYNLVGYSDPLFAGATPGFVGLYQVNFQVPPLPPGTPACGGNIGSNLTISLVGVLSIDGFGICVE